MRIQSGQPTQNLESLRDHLHSKGRKADARHSPEQSSLLGQHGFRWRRSSRWWKTDCQRSGWRAFGEIRPMTTTRLWRRTRRRPATPSRLRYQTTECRGHRVRWSRLVPCWKTRPPVQTLRLRWSEMRGRRRSQSRPQAALSRSPLPVIRPVETRVPAEHP